MISLACCHWYCCSVTTDCPLAWKTCYTHGVTSITIGDFYYFCCQMSTLDFVCGNHKMDILQMLQGQTLWFLIIYNCQGEASQASSYQDCVQSCYKGTPSHELVTNGNRLLVCLLTHCSNSPKWSLCVGCCLQYFSSEDQLCNWVNSPSALCITGNTSYHPASAMLSSTVVTYPSLPRAKLSGLLFLVLSGEYFVVFRSPTSTLHHLVCRKRKWDSTVSNVFLKALDWCWGHFLRAEVIKVWGERCMLVFDKNNRKLVLVVRPDYQQVQQLQLLQWLMEPMKAL